MIKTDKDISEAIMNGCDGCSTCPFTIGEESDQVQNYGCIPTLHEILDLARETHKAWKCHGDDRICRGYASVAKRLGLPLRGEMNTLTEWTNS